MPVFRPVVYEPIYPIPLALTIVSGTPPEWPEPCSVMKLARSLFDQRFQASGTLAAIAAIDRHRKRDPSSIRVAIKKMQGRQHKGGLLTRSGPLRLGCIEGNEFANPGTKRIIERDVMKRGWIDPHRAPHCPCAPSQFAGGSGCQGITDLGSALGRVVDCLPAEHLKCIGRTPLRQQGPTLAVNRMFIVAIRRICARIGGINDRCIVPWGRLNIRGSIPIVI